MENIQLSQTGETFRIQIPVVHEVKEKKDEDDDMPESPTMTKIIPMSKSGFLQTIIRQPFFPFWSDDSCGRVVNVWTSYRWA